MLEPFETLDTEHGTTSSFRTLLATMFIAVTISLVLSMRAVVAHMYRYPETLGLIMAVQLLIGRYTGYRLLELYRFRDFVQEPASEGCEPHVEAIISTKLFTAGRLHDHLSNP